MRYQSKQIAFSVIAMHYIFTPVNAQTRSCSPGTYMAMNGECAPHRDCFPGSFVTVWGSSTADRQCAPCPSGTFSTELNQLQCAPYNDCPAGTIVSGQPSASAGRVCHSCHTLVEFSATVNQLACTPLSVCPAGTYVLGLPTRASDRRCATCPEGTFSVSDNTHRCAAQRTCATDGTEYESIPGTTSTSRRCTTATPECPETHVQTTPLTTTTDRVCVENLCRRVGSYARCPLDFPNCRYVMHPNDTLSYECTSEPSTTLASTTTIPVADEAASDTGPNDATLDIVIIVIFVVLGLTAVLFVARLARPNNKQMAVSNYVLPFEQGVAMEITTTPFQNMSIPYVGESSSDTTGVNASNISQNSMGMATLANQNNLTDKLQEYSWFHGTTRGREGDFSKLHDTSGNIFPDGTFFAAAINKKSTDYPGFVLNITFRGEPTRHLVKDMDGSGILRVNTQKYGSFTTLQDVVRAVTGDELPSQWPIRLTHTIDRTTKDRAPVSCDAAPPRPPISAMHAKKAVATTVKLENRAWFHGATLGKEEDFAKLHNHNDDKVYPDGTFFVVEAAPDKGMNAWVFNIVFRGKATRHMVRDVDGSGILAINKTTFGNYRTVEELIGALSATELPPRWPVRLSHTVDRDTHVRIPVDTLVPSPPPSVSTKRTSAPSASSAQVDEHHVPKQSVTVPSDNLGDNSPTSTPTATQKTSEKSVSSTDTALNHQPWFHGKTKGKAADFDKLTSSDAHFPDGTFFAVEIDEESADYPGYIFNIVFRGNPTRHLVKDMDGNGILTVNTKKYGTFTTLEELVAALTVEDLPPKWPVQLTHTVDRQTGALVHLREDTNAKSQLSSTPQHGKMESSPLEVASTQHVVAVPPLESIQADSQSESADDSIASKWSTCQYVSATGRVCTKVVGSEFSFCPNHLCPSCNKSKTSKARTCEACAPAKADGLIDPTLEQHLWFHGSTLGKAADFDKLQKKNKVYPDGTFFAVEIAHNSCDYPGWIFNITFRGKPTRHLVKANDAGILAVNNATYGDFRSVDSLVDALVLDDLPPKWPIQLTHTVRQESGKRVKL